MRKRQGPGAIAQAIHGESVLGSDKRAIVGTSTEWREGLALGTDIWAVDDEDEQMNDEDDDEMLALEQAAGNNMELEGQNGSNGGNSSAKKSSNGSANRVTTGDSRIKALGRLRKTNFWPDWYKSLEPRSGVSLLSTCPDALASNAERDG